MGVLTETTMRLREEIVASRHARAALRGNLVRQADERRTQVSALCAGFASDRAGAQRAWAGRAPATPKIHAPAAQTPAEHSRPSPEPHSKGARKH
jgi:hypothetical protein